MAFDVPTLDAPRASNQALPAPFARANHTGAEYLASAVVAPAADTALKFAQDLKGKYDGAAVEEALNKQADHQRALAAKAKAAENMGALPAASEASDAADKYAKELYAGLANDDQKRAFSFHANRSLMQFNGIAEAHAAEQVKAFDAQEYLKGNANDRLNVNTNPDLPGVVAAATDNITRRVNQRLRVLDIPVTSEQGKALLADELAHMRVGYVKTLNSLGAVDRADAFINDNPGGFGEAQAELVAEVTRERNLAGGRRFAEDARAAYPTPDGMFDTTKANDAAKAKYPAGSRPLEAALEAVQVLARRTEGDVALKAKQGFNTWLGSYEGTNADQARRNLDDYKAGPNRALFYAMTPAYQDAAEDMWRVAQAHKANKPMTEWERVQYQDLMFEIAGDPDRFGGVGAKDLALDKRYRQLPPHQKDEVGAAVGRAHQDRNSPEAVSRTLTPDLLSAGVRLGYLSDKAGHGLPSTWPADDQAKWVKLQTLGLPAALAFKHDEKNKGVPFPIDQVEGIVREARRTYTIEGGGRVWGDRNDATREEAAATNKPVHPNAEDDEVDRGTKVLILQGFRPDVTTGYFTPDEKIRANEAWAAVQGGPPPGERAEIIRQAGGRRLSESEIRATYEKTVLKYQLKPPAYVLKPRVYDASHRQGR